MHVYKSKGHTCNKQNKNKMKCTLHTPIYVYIGSGPNGNHLAICNSPVICTLKSLHIFTHCMHHFYLLTHVTGTSS